MADIETRPHIKSDIELEKWPQDYKNYIADYALIQRKVNLAMFHGAKDCIGEACDLQENCIRHARTADLVNRYLRRKK